MLKRTLRDARLVALGSRALDVLLLEDSRTAAGEWGKDRLRKALDKLDEAQEPAHVAVLTALVRQCGNVGALEEGRRAHGLVQRRGLGGAFWANLLMQMYGKCGCPEEARQVFDLLLVPDDFSWTIMLTAYAQNGQVDKAAELFCKVPKPSVVASSIMVTAYANAGDVVRARSAFDGSPERNVVSWNSIITAYGRSGYEKEALAMFASMDQDGSCTPNHITFVASLDACCSCLSSSSTSVSLRRGRTVHAVALTSDAGAANVMVETAVVNMYSRCGSVDDAKQAFDAMAAPNSISWSSMVAAFANNGNCHQALHTFRAMDAAGVKCNDVTFVSAIDACAGAGVLETGRQVHAAIAELRHARDTKVCNALINMYSKCGSLEEAEVVFHSMVDRNVVTWTALVAALANAGRSGQALAAFATMDLEGVVANEVTLVAALDACSKMPSLVMGRRIHGAAATLGLEAKLVVTTALVSMYAKCGSLDEAWEVFVTAPTQDTVLSNAMVSAFGGSGQSWRAIEAFQLDEQRGGCRASRVTFLSLLSACGQAGLVADARACFVAMGSDYLGLFPDALHYECMVDCLARAGRLDQAEELLRYMPFTPSNAGMLSLLSQSDCVRAERLASQMLDNDPTTYVMLSNTLTSCATGLDELALTS